jgi:hypothetical protein
LLLLSTLMLEAGLETEAQPEYRSHIDAIRTE